MQINSRPIMFQHTYTLTCIPIIIFSELAFWTVVDTFYVHVLYKLNPDTNKHIHTYFHIYTECSFLIKINLQEYQVTDESRVKRI